MFKNFNHYIFYIWNKKIISILFVFLLPACSTMTKQDLDIKRTQLNLMADEAVAEFIKQYPDLQQKLDGAVGYAVGDITMTKIPVIGAGFGSGVLFDNERGETRYLNIKRFDLGGGLGALSYKALVILLSREQYTHFLTNGYIYSANTETSNSTSVKTNIVSKEGYQVFLLAESGASASITARAVKVSVDTDLTPMAESETKYPTLHGNLEPDGITSEEPRVWEYKLPFMAQEVIDMGFDLPSPYGIGITYARVNQDLKLTDLEVGFNGSGMVPIDFVSFDSASAENDSVQLMADVWLLPFMNVYAVVGVIEGNAPLEFTIDGDSWLAQAGIDCSQPINAIQCNLLQGNQLTVPVDAEYQGTNVGVGTVLAGGWGDYFIAIPITYVVSDIDIANSKIEAFNVAPRIGKVFDMQDNGRLSIYIGGGYLDVEMDITGSVDIPGGGGVIDYKIHQKNKDKWNAVIGENWDISKYWSWTAEIGFAGSREHFITALTYRY